MPNPQMQQLTDDVRKQVEVMAADLQKNMLSAFEGILTGDFKSLQSNINNILKEQQARIMKESENNVRAAIKQKFGGNIFGSILSDFIVPAVYDSQTQHSSRSGSFQSAEGNMLKDFAGAVGRARVRNS